jgi:hypothetical protein
MRISQGKTAQEFHGTVTKQDLQIDIRLISTAGFLADG